jgi:hypothetical protein
MGANIAHLPQVDEINTPQPLDVAGEYVLYDYVWQCSCVDEGARNGAYYVFHPKLPHLADHVDPGGLDLLLSRSVVISHGPAPMVILHQ